MILVNPDTHGRLFWKNHLDVDKYSQVVFLGDYLDPYPWETGIDKASSLENFKEILEFKKKFPDKVILLLGNHDTHYLFGDDDCRIDSKNFFEIQKLLKDNYNLFKFGILLGNFSFTHAPVHKEWASEVNLGSMSLPEIITTLNNLWESSVKKDNFEKLENFLCRASWVRGGIGDYGSPIWADFRELKQGSDPWPGYYQVFGHTQLRKDPFIDDHFACLDCRKSFIIDNKTITEA